MNGPAAPAAPLEEELQSAWQSLDALRGSAMLDEARAYAARQRQAREAKRRVAKATTAVALAAALLAVWAGFGWRKPLEVATAIGEVRQVELADGSRVTLDGDSQLRVSYGPLARNVRLLRGQAWFEVAKDPARPFTVRAGSSAVTALGTAFEVASGGSGVTVTLEHGSVRVDAPAEAAPLTLSPGDHVRLSRAGALLERRRLAPGRSGAWRSGLIDLDGVSLAAALEEINRHAARRVVVHDPVALGTPVSGVFHAGDEEAFTNALSGLFDESCSQAPDEAVILCRPARP